jgi:hypothetical protein
MNQPDPQCGRREELSQSGIEPATFRLVAQCFNQLRHPVLHVACIFIQWRYYFRRPLLAIICNCGSVEGYPWKSYLGGGCQIIRCNINGLYTSHWFTEWQQQCGMQIKIHKILTGMWGRKRILFCMSLAPRSTLPTLPLKQTSPLQMYP